jgi:hypothetical protein
MLWAQLLPFGQCVQSLAADVAKHIGAGEFDLAVKVVDLAKRIGADESS